MKSGQVLVIALLAAAAVFVAGVTYNIYHYKHLAEKSASSAAPAARTAPVPPPPPSGPATTIKPVKDALKAGILNPIFYVQTQMQMLQRGLVAALNMQRITLDDLDKLDFNPAPTTDPYNVFNPNGKVRYTPLGGAWLDQSLIDRLTTKKGTPLLFNMRRTEDALGTSEVLYAVIPNIAPANCGPQAGNQVYTSDGGLSVENDPHTIVDDPPGMPIIDVGCVRTPNGLIWMFDLKLRYRHKGETRWGSR